MKHFLTTSVKILLVSLFLMCASVLHAQVSKYNEQGVYKGVVKVKFAPSVTEQLSTMKEGTRSGKLSTGITRFDKAVSKMGATHMERLFPYNAKTEHKSVKHGLHLWYIVYIDEGVDPEVAALQLYELPEVASVDCERQISLQPYKKVPYSAPSVRPMGTMPFNDPSLPDQWHYDNRGQTGHADADINLFEAWQKTAGRRDIIVAVMDQGVDVGHEDLAANMWINTGEIPGDGIDNDGNGYIDDIYGFNFDSDRGSITPEYHGTHVSGTIAAVNNNGVGVSGVAGGSGSGDGVRIMSCQIMGGALFIERAYKYAADNGAVISQNSWGYPSHSPNFPEQHPALLAGIDYFIDEAGDYPGSPMKGGIVIFAAGNNCENGLGDGGCEGLYWPGCYERVLSVTAIGPEWKKTKYSNFGTWTHVAAPGGDNNASLGYTSKDMILSTAPFNQYSYDAGTSMACPHVSGIAALALANSPSQMTNRELWNRLVTGVVDIDAQNPAYIGKLGSGAIDAALVMADNSGIVPNAITDLAVLGATQEDVRLGWTVPTDSDDGQPMSYDIYYHTTLITAENLSQAVKKSLDRSKLLAGESAIFEIDGLYGYTDYYFAIICYDRWANASGLSNVAHVRTDKGPEVDYNTGEVGNTLTINIDASVSTTGSKTFDLLNNGEGLLRWNHYYRTGIIQLATMSLGGHSSPAVAPKTLSDMRTQWVPASNEPVTFGLFSQGLERDGEDNNFFYPVTKSLLQWPNATPHRYIGDEDASLPTSGAIKFTVTEDGGFNLTQLIFFLTYKSGTGPLRVEVYKGSDIATAELLLTQYQTVPSTIQNQAVTVEMIEQLFFKKGEEFWVAIHVPGGNLYPLPISPRLAEAPSNSCYYSADDGQNWVLLATAIANTTFAWHVYAVSNNNDLGEYLTLTPAKGEVLPLSSEVLTVEVDASRLINGQYKTNLVITSNDANRREMKVPVVINVEGHKPKLVYSDVVNFGSALVGQSVTVPILIENRGFGLVKNLTTSIIGSDFEIEGSAPTEYAARSLNAFMVTFKPTAAGNLNAKLQLTNGTDTYIIPLYGVGGANSKITVTPMVQTVTPITLGDNVTATITVKNDGGYPLKYFFPSFDEKGIGSGWPMAVHKYGYTEKSGDDLSDPIAYAYQDISTTGVNVVSQFLAGERWVSIPFGFDFPYYNGTEDSLHICKNGFTVFRKNINPGNNLPTLTGGARPGGFISPVGHVLYFDAPGTGVFYKTESDKVIVQYLASTDVGASAPNIEAQVVLHANGNIRFYYKEITTDNWALNYFNVLIESPEQTDGILLNGFDRRYYPIANGYALGFDYPGADIITSATNASGILSPGDTETITLTMDTDNLSEGIHKRYVNIISNDPDSPVANALINLDITSGGTFSVEESTSSISFGTIYQGFPYVETFSIKNNGTQLTDVTSVTVTPAGSFTVTPAAPYPINPGANQQLEVSANTTAVASLSGIITVTFSNGHTVNINVDAEVLDGPIISANNTLLSETLAIGATSSYPYTISNTGLSDLEYVVNGGLWYRFEDPNPSTKYSHAVYTHNNGEPSYDWIDIMETGVRLEPLWDNPTTKEEFWRLTLDALPFPVKFFGRTYNKLRVADNGMISFGEYLPLMYPLARSLPLEGDEAAFILPLFMPLNYRADLGEDKPGLYYQYFADKIVITWEYVGNVHGQGNPISVQVVMYENGAYKIQYKIRENPTKEGEYLEYSTGKGTIALQGHDKNVMFLSAAGTNLVHNDGFAFLIVPSETKVLAPGQSTTGNIVFDATNVYSGIGAFEDNLVITSNDPATPIVEKPLSLIVTGTTTWDVPIIPTEIDLGEFEIKEDQSGTKVTYRIKLPIENTGTTPIVITKGELVDGISGLNMELYNNDRNSWSPITVIWRPSMLPPWLQPPGKTYTILPGETLDAYLTFKPTVAGSKQTDINLTTSGVLGIQTITVKAKGYTPPEIDVDNTPIVITMNTPSEVEERDITVGNNSVEFDLTYESSIEYLRNLPAPAAATLSVSDAQVAAAGRAEEASLAQVSSSERTAITQPVRSYTQLYRYFSDTDGLYATVGTDGGKTRQINAVKFKAGAQGANISDVGVWVRRESVLSGYVTAELRVGSSRSPGEAVTVASGRYTFQETVSDNFGKLVNIELDKSVQIYPNEEFFVVFTYPLAIFRPFGIVLNEENLHAPNRYYAYAEVEVEGESFYTWVDAQSYYGMSALTDQEGGGFIAYAAEQVPNASGWLRIVDNTSGVIPTTGTLNIKIEASGTNAHEGSQKANVVIKSNDTNNPTVKVPVELKMNEAPQFTGSENPVLMSEDEVRTVVLTVVDNEGHAITSVSEVDMPSIAACSISGSTVTLTLTTTYGDAGSYVAKLRAEDSFGAVNDFEQVIIVAKKNREPQGVNDAPFWKYSLSENARTHYFTDLFVDPDGDKLTGSVTVARSGIVEVYQAGSTATSFAVKPVAVGETTLTVTTRDESGAIATIVVGVEVTSCEEEVIVQKWNSTLLINNKSNKYKSDGYQWYKNGKEIAGATKQYYTADALDFTAQYHARMIATNGEAVYTCPFTPQDKGVSLKVYPNPVSKGQAVTASVQLPDLNLNPVTIQVVNLRGEVVSTQTTSERINSVQMPAVEGTYLIKISDGSAEETFKVIVK